MADSNIKPIFSLYHTLKKPTGLLSPSRKEKIIKELKVGMAKLDERQSEAVVGIVCEHARVCDGWSTLLEDISFPYGCKSNNSEEFVINLIQFPDGLLQILKEFLRVAAS